MDTKRTDVIMASDITAAAEAVEKNQPTSPEVVAAIQDAERRDAQITDPEKKIVFDPSKDPQFAAAAAKAMQEYLSRLPKHGNYMLCLKKCPLFKECQCFKKNSAAQKKCFEELIAALPRFAGVTLAIPNCDRDCQTCGALKKCFAANKDIVKREMKEADAREAAEKAKASAQQQ